VPGYNIERSVVLLGGEKCVVKFAVKLVVGFIFVVEGGYGSLEIACIG